MKVLAISNLFPNRIEPTKAAFNRQQFRSLAELCELHVVTPVPRLSRLANSIPCQDEIEGIPVYYPRYLHIPKILRWTYGWLMFLGIFRTVRKLEREKRFDAIYATWAFPDAYAAAMIARRLGKRLIVKVHGTDINVGAQRGLRRRLTRSALRQADSVVAVSDALAQKIVDLGIDPSRVEVIPNGVDTKMFRPDPERTDVRSTFEQIDREKRQILFVGNLTLIKGITHLIDAMSHLPEEIRLNIVGDGELRQSLKLQCEAMGMTDRVHFFGRQPHEEIPLWMNACDLLCLPSLDEGCPNVVLESLACGLPVVASHVGGIPDLILADQYGRTVPPGNAIALAKAIENVLDENESSDGVRQPIGRAISWRENAEQTRSLLFPAMISA